MLNFVDVENTETELPVDEQVNRNRQHVYSISFSNVLNARQHRPTHFSQLQVILPYFKSIY